MSKIKDFYNDNKDRIKKEVKRCYVYGVTAVACISLILVNSYDKIIRENKLDHYFYK